MPKASKASIHLLIFAASLALTLSVRATLTTRYTAERYRIEREARAKRTVQIATQWNKLAATAENRV